MPQGLCTGANRQQSNGPIKFHELVNGTDRWNCHENKMELSPGMRLTFPRPVGSTITAGCPLIDAELRFLNVCRVGGGEDLSISFRKCEIMELQNLSNTTAGMRTR